MTQSAFDQPLFGVSSAPKCGTAATERIQPASPPPPHLLRRRQRGPLLHDLLVAALHAAVAREQRHHIAVPVRHQLHLQVARLGGELHRKDGGARHLALDLLEHRAHVLVALHLADALAAAAPGRLEHDGVAAGVGGQGRCVRCWGVEAGSKEPAAMCCYNRYANAARARQQQQHTNHLHTPKPPQQRAPPTRSCCRTRSPPPGRTRTRCRIRPGG